MNKKLIKIALIGKTNAGKSTLINSIIGEKISITNKKINTTQEYIIGVKNLKNTQLIFYDTPGVNYLKSKNFSQKKLKTNLWQAISQIDILVYMIDVKKYNYKTIHEDILKISETEKLIILVFNKIDLIQKNKILPFIEELKKIKKINNFFIISAKYKKGLDELLKFLISKSYKTNWLYNKNEITNKDDVYITNECTRNATLYYLNEEIPYNINITNKLFKYLKNDDLKIKQLIEISNPRYQGIILGKKGITIKRIREKSQKDIQKIFNYKVHLYLQVILKDEK